MGRWEADGIRKKMQRNGSIITGYLLVAASAVTFSIKGIIAKLLYANGVDPVTLLALRFAIALPFFWLIVFLDNSDEKVGGRDLLILVLSGVLGLYLAALANFYGLMYIDASLERIVLYTYPSMVVILTAIFFKERIDARKLVSIALTYAGLALALNLFNGTIKTHLVGAALVFFSAAVYSVSYLVTESTGRRVSGARISAYTATAATFAFVGTWHGRSIPTGVGTWTLLTIMAILCTVIPIVTLAVGIKIIGASKAALVGFVGPIATAILAYAILGEELGTVQIFGMALVLSGVFVISSEKAKADEPPRKKLRGI